MEVDDGKVVEIDTTTTLTERSESMGKSQSPRIKGIPGYQGYSMSNNAVLAYEEGLLPASKIKGVPPVLIREFCRYNEWHHTSKRFNKVNFYDPTYVRCVFGLEESEQFEANPEAVEALSNYRSNKDNTVVYENCTVEWLEWRGTKSHPRAKKWIEKNRRVDVKGQTATVKLQDGSTLKKRLTTNGFRFEVTGVDGRKEVEN